MGKPQQPYRDLDELPPPDTAISGSQGGDYDDVPTLDEPPPYTENEDDNCDQYYNGDSSGPSTAPIINALATRTHPALQEPYDKNNIQIIMDPDYDTQPKFLEEAVMLLAPIPPEPTIRIRGTHQETIHRANKDEQRLVVDFDFCIDLGDRLRTINEEPGIPVWKMKTASPADKTYRGGIFKTQSPKYKQSDLEGYDPASFDKLEEWCHLYCASPAALKSFRLTRKVDLDEDFLRSVVTGIVRDTGYMGQVNISFPIRNRAVEFHSSSRINKWRHTRWIRWVFYLSFLWIFAWPYLFFVTRRWAVVTVEWPFMSHPAVGEDEEYQARLYSVRKHEGAALAKCRKAIGNAVLNRRAGGEFLGGGNGVPSGRWPIETRRGNWNFSASCSLLQTSVWSSGGYSRSGGWGGDC